LEVPAPACAASCTVNEPEPCSTATDNINGGCNSTPESYTNVTAGSTVCGNGWAHNNQRDTDWYRITTSASGKLQVHIKKTGGLDFVAIILTGTCAGLAQPGLNGDTSGTCGAATAQNLGSGVQVRVAIVPGTNAGGGIFTGF